VVEFMLRGDDNGIEEASTCSIIQSIGQRDRGAEVNGVHHQSHGIHTPRDHLGVIPKGKQSTEVVILGDKLKGGCSLLGGQKMD
jgi:hypothetical protein